MMSHTPIPRLRHFEIGDRVKLPHDKDKVFTIKSFKDGYVELSHLVTACEGHPCEGVK